MIKKHIIYYVIPTRKKTACKPWVQQYATDVKNHLYLARLQLLCKTGCVPHYFQYKEVALLFFPQSLSLKFFIIIFLTSVAYCSTTCTLHEYAHPVIYNNPEFRSYRTAVMLSDLDFVAPNNEHIFFMRWHQTRVKTVGAMGVSYDMLIVSPAQKYVWVGLWVGLYWICFI